MTDQNSSHFKIGTEEEQPDLLLESEIADQRIDRLSHRLTLLSILLPCLVSLILVITYLDIKKRFTLVQGSGEKEVQSLSKNIESSYATLSVQLAKLEETVKSGLSALEKRIDSLKKDVDQAEKSITSLNASQSTQKDLKNAVSEIDKKFIQLTDKINLLDQDLRPKITPMTRALEASREDITQIKETVSSLSTAMIQRKDLEVALKAEQLSFQQKLGLVSEDLRKKLAITQVNIQELEKRLGILEQKSSTKTESPLPGNSPIPPAVPRDSAEQPAGKLTPGNIIEQDIQ